MDHGKLIFSGYQVIITATPAPTSIRWREDYQCGPDFPLEDGGPTECNPNSPNYCCSPHGWCGNTPQHCSCYSCINYREEYSGDTQSKNLKMSLKNTSEFTNIGKGGGPDWVIFQTFDFQKKNKLCLSKFKQF